MEVAEVVIEHVRRRIERAQRTVERQRRRGKGPPHALRQHDLHRVAGGDVFLGAPHRMLEAVGAEFAFGLRQRARGLERDRHRLAQPAAQRLQPIAGLRIGIGCAGVGVDDQVDLAGEIVDDGELLGEQEQDIGNAGESLGGRRRPVGEPRLDVPHGVVAEVAGESAAKPRQPGPRRGAEAAHVLADERQRIALVALDHGSAFVDLDRRAARTDADLRRQSDERIAPEPLAPDHGFEEEGVRPVRQLDVERQRRIEVGERLEDERNAVVPARGERAKLAFGHDASTIAGVEAHRMSEGT